MAASLKQFRPGSATLGDRSVGFHSGAGTHGGCRVAGQESRPLDLRGEFSVRPDLVISKCRDPVVVLDAEYKLDDSSADICQAPAYCHAQGIRRAILAYPSGTIGPADRHRVRPDAAIELVRLPIDLSGSVEDLRSRTAAFVDAVYREV